LSSHAQKGKRRRSWAPLPVVRRRRCRTICANAPSKRYAARLNATKSQTYLARTVSSLTGGCSEDEQGASIVSSRGCYAWPMIVTERLLLRRWKAEDLQPYAEICADSEVMRWIGNGSTRSRSECARVIETFEQRWDRSGSRCKHPSDWQRGVPANHG